MSEWLATAIEGVSVSWDEDEECAKISRIYDTDEHFEPIDPDPDYDAIHRAAEVALAAHGILVRLERTDHCDGGEGGTERQTEEVLYPSATLLFQCECGLALGELCASKAAPVSGAVVVEWMPEWLRASHEAAGNHGSYPHNGSVRFVASRSCADEVLSGAGDWASIVEDADPAEYAGE